MVRVPPTVAELAVTVFEPLIRVHEYDGDGLPLAEHVSETVVFCITDSVYNAVLGVTVKLYALPDGVLTVIFVTASAHRMKRQTRQSSVTRRCRPLVLQYAAGSKETYTALG